MQDNKGDKMSNTWKYVKEIDTAIISEIEKTYSINLPDDYKQSLEFCNGGKPLKDKFDIIDRKECVVDYMTDVNDSSETKHMISKHNIFPIASDPFGNSIGYLIKTNKLTKIVFWNHESNDITFIADSFNKFLSLLY